MTSLFGAPALAASGDGRLELFVFDIEGNLWHMYQTAWSDGWSALGAFSGPWSGPIWPAALAPSGDGRLEAFVSAEDVLWHNYQTIWSNGWDGWSSMPTPEPDFEGVPYAPGLAADANGEVMAFLVMLGSMWRLQQAAWSDGWQNWQPHGTPSGSPGLLGPVTAGRSGDGRVEVFVVDLGGTLWNIRQTAPGSPFSGWNDFGSPGVTLADRPALARSADGRLELFVTGQDGSLYHQWETAVGTFTWSGWMSMGNPAGAGGLVDHPVLAASADGRLELFITGSDGNVWHMWQMAASNGWSDWDPARPPPGAGGAAAPDVAPSGDRRLELFVVGADGNLWHQWQTAASNGWSDWVSCGQP